MKTPFDLSRDDDLDRALRTLDPAAGPLPPLDHAAMLARATGEQSAARTGRLQALQKASRWTLPAAIAAAALAIAGVSLVDGGSAAGSDLVLAAAETQSSASGRVVGSVEVRQAPGILQPGGWDFSFAYDGGDFRAVIDEGVRVQRVIGLEDTLFTTFAPADGWTSEPREIAGEDPSIEEYLGVAAAGRPVDGLVALLEETGSVETGGESGEAAGADGAAQIYTGELSVEALQGLDKLPPGASFLVAATRAEAPDTIGITAEVTGGRLTDLELTLTGATTAGPMDITVASRFLPAADDLTIAAPSQVLPPPAADECRVIGTGDGGITESPGCAPLLAEIDRFYAENPDDPCTTQMHTPKGSDEEFVRCLRAGGHDEAADAYEIYRSAFPPSMR